MATRVHDVQVRMVADLRDLETQLAKAPNITDKTARQMTNRFMRQWRKMEQQLKRSNVGNAASASMGQLGSSTDKATQAFRALSIQAPDVFQQLAAGQAPMQVLIQQGGQVAQQFQAMGLAGGILNAVVGPLGVGIAAIGTAAVVVANQTQEARMRLEEYRDVINSSTDATHQLARSQSALKLATGDVAGFVADLEIQAAVLNGTIDKTDLELGKLGNRLADELKPELLEAGKAFAENEARIKKLEEAAGQLGFAEEAKRVAELNEAMSARTGLQKQLDQVKKLSQEGREAINAYGEALRGAATDTETTKGAANAYKASLQELEEQAQRNIAATAALRSEQARWREEVARLELGDELFELNQRLGELNIAFQHGHISAAEFAELRSAAEVEYQDQLRRSTQMQKQASAETATQVISDQERIRENQEQTISSLTSTAGEAGGVLADLAELAAERGIKATTALAGASKAAASFEAVVNTARAVSLALASAPPPANFINAGLVAAAGGVQIAKINQASMPAFALGGEVSAPLPGQRTVVQAEQGERILTAQQNRDLTEFMRGGGGGGGVLMLRHRVVDQIVSETMGAGGRLSRETRGLRARGRSNPYNRGLL